MKNLKIVLDGDCPIKKNAMKQMHFRTDKKTGRRIPLQYPLRFYSKNYKDWVAKHVVTLEKWKNQHSQIKFPLKGDYFVGFWFFKKARRKVDLSNLYEAPQDLLAGDAGKKLLESFPAHRFQIFDDDNCNIIVNHASSSVFHDPANPRTEIYISRFKLQKLGNIHKFIFEDEPLPDVDTFKYQKGLFE